MTKPIFTPVPASTVPSLLDGREYDRRVTYGTLVPKPTKAYPVVGQRQRERADRKNARISGLAHTDNSFVAEAAALTTSNLL